MRYVILFVVTIMTFSSNAQETGVKDDAFFPQQLTAKELLLACNSSSLTSVGRKKQHFCLGFVSGVEEGIRFYDIELGNSAASNFCIPSKTKSKQLVDAFNKYAIANQTDLDKPAALMIVKALNKTFPCIQ